jgi:F-type H+-transporting ATPase subunit epsilon
MSETIQLDIVTPEKKIFSDKGIESVTVPGIEGDMGILPNHIPIITFLKSGKIIIETSGKQQQLSYFISDGVLEFNNNVLTILASEIYDLETISSKDIEHLKIKAKEKNSKQDLTDNEIFLASKFQEEVDLLSSSK